MAKKQIEKILAGLAGEYLVAGQLCLEGYVPSLTFKNYPNVDIFYVDPATGKNGALQVKTIRGGKKYFVPEKVDSSQTPFVFVRINSDHFAEFWIVSAKKVKTLSAKRREKYLDEHPHAKKKQPRMLSIKDLADFKDK